jgi:hypothetical protein
MLAEQLLGKVLVKQPIRVPLSVVLTPTQEHYQLFLRLTT